MRRMFFDQSPGLKRPIGIQSYSHSPTTLFLLLRAIILNHGKSLALFLFCDRHCRLSCALLWAALLH